MKNNLKTIRGSMTIDELAELSSCSISRISDIENNIHIPSLIIQQKLANALGVRPNEIFTK